jgi:hypothetical protein
MKLLSNLFNHKIGSEAEAIIKKISKWEQEHFSDAGYMYDIKTGNRLTNSRYTKFKNDSGSTVDLSSISLMFTENPERKGIFNRLKNLTNPQPKPSLPALIAQYRSDVSKEIQTYRANVKKLDNLDGTLKRDSFFEEIDRLFRNKLKVLYNELVFCKFDALGEPNYFYKIHGKLTSLCKDMQSLNTYFSEYMYALSRLEYEDNKQDLERIQISVKAMSDAVDAVKSDS